LSQSVPLLSSLISMWRPPSSTLFPYTTLFRSLLLGNPIRVTRFDPSATMEQFLSVWDKDIENPHTDKFDLHRMLVDKLHAQPDEDRKSTRLNSSHVSISYAVFCLKKKNTTNSE